MKVFLSVLFLFAFLAQASAQENIPPGTRIEGQMLKQETQGETPAPEQPKFFHLDRRRVTNHRIPAPPPPASRPRSFAPAMLNGRVKDPARAKDLTVTPQGQIAPAQE